MKNYKHFVAIVAILLAAAIWPPITNAFEKSSCSNNSTTNWFVDKNIDDPSTIFQALSSEQKSNHTFHLFSHGRPGELLINGEWKNAQQIAAFLSKEMPSNCTHLNIYGCSFARGDLGKKAMSFLKDKLNLTIAASNNTTGIDGDWNLEEGTPKESISVSNYLGNLQTTCPPKEYITNGSFKCHTNAFCPNLNTGTLKTNTVCGWADGTVFDPTYMVYDPTNACNYNMPASNWPVASAITSGHNSLEWFGIETTTGPGYGHVLVNLLSDTLQPGTHTVTFWAGIPAVKKTLNVPGTSTTVPTPVILYGWQPSEPPVWGGPSTIPPTPTYGKTLGTSVAVSNILTATSTSNDWVKYTITFTTTTPIDKIAFLQSTTNGYVYIDDISIIDTDTDCCLTSQNKMGPNCDYDGDGILNSNDMDDDNDGILDAIENPSCFVPASQVGGNLSSYALSLNGPVTTDLYQSSSGHLGYMAFDGVIYLGDQRNTAIVVYNQDWINKALYTWEYKASVPISSFTIKLTSWYWNAGGTATGFQLGSSGSSIKLQGSTNGTTWVDLSTPVNAFNDKEIILINSLQTNSSFKFYRILGVSGTTNPTNVGYIDEIIPTINQSIYNPSSNPVLNCTAPLDTDNDGIANMFDLDSDGDGCADAVEGGATFNYANLSPSNISGGNTGVNYSGIVNYGVTSNLGNVVSTSGSTIGIPTIATVGQTVGTSQNVGQKDALCCPAGSTAPTLTTTSATNTCPATGVNLFNYISSNFSNIVWFTNNTHTGSAITTASSASAGTYYAFYYDVTENCYSPASAAFTVVTTSCVPVTNNCNPVEYITNGSFECHVNTCVNFNIGTIPTNEVCGWYDGTVYDPTFMMYDGVNNCIYNMPASNYPPASAITGGHTGQAWMGIGQSAFSSVHALVNTMQYTLAPGTHTLTFWAGVLPQIQPFFGGYANTGPTALTLYGYAPGEAVVFSDFGTVTGSNLGSTPVITNYITSNNQTWVQYSMTFTNTKPMSRLSLMHYNNAYVYIDDISIMDVNQTCCTTTDKSGLYCDYDSDGILNANDLDDDNDGIMDAVENPSCFYTAAEVTGNATSYATTVKLPILTEMKMSAALFPMESAFDGLNPYAPQSLPTVGTGWSIWDQDWVNKTLIQWQYNAAIPVTQFTIYQNNYPGYVFGTAGSTIKLQGSVDGTNWLDLSYPVSAYTDIAFSLPNTLQAGVSFNYYRLRGVTGSSLRENKAIVEIAPTINTTAYNPSVNPKTNCSTPLDTDGDGIANMFDLDSDGDGCADAVEGGATFNYANLLSSTIPGGNTGVNYSGIVNYGVTSNLGNVVSTSVSTFGIPTIASSGQTIGTSQNVGQKDAACCLAGTTAPALTATTATNVCPATGVNLNNYVPASSFNVLWFTNNTHTGTAISNSGSVSTGIYYAYFYDSANNCYSPASAFIR
ncbi:MAG: DUF4347 domain-containing protein [Saprospiraceae bacterium]|nr:DUF4347 domain-containing protein [Saprospiraceae bacterium]